MIDFFDGSVTIPRAKKVEYLETNNLRGITVKELFKDDKDMLNRLEEWSTSTGVSRKAKK